MDNFKRIEEAAGNIQMELHAEVLSDINALSSSVVKATTHPSDRLLNDLVQSENDDTAELLQDLLAPVQHLLHPISDLRRHLDEVTQAGTESMDERQVKTLEILRGLPPDSSNISSEEAEAIYDRFVEKYHVEVSSGRASMCFENHVNYLLGTRTALNSIQKELIKKLCTAVKYRPAPALFMAHYVLQYIDFPQPLRAIISASIWGKVRNVQRVIGHADTTIDELLSGRDGPIDAYDIGYSKPLAMSAVRLSKIAEKTGRHFSLLIPKISEPTKGAGNPSLQLLRNHGIDCRELSVNEIAEHDLSITLASAQLWTWDHRNNLNVLADREQVRTYRSFVARRTLSLEFNGVPPVVVISGTFKFWPERFRKHYHDAFKDSREGLRYIRELQPISSRHIHSLVTERGISSNQIFKSFDTSDNLDQYAMSNDIFSSPAWSLTEEKDKFYDELFEKFIDRVKPSTAKAEFVITSSTLLSLMFGNSGEYNGKLTFSRSHFEPRSEGFMSYAERVKALFDAMNAEMLPAHGNELINIKVSLSTKVAPDIVNLCNELMQRQGYETLCRYSDNNSLYIRAIDPNELDLFFQLASDNHTQIRNTLNSTSDMALIEPFTL